MVREITSEVEFDALARDPNNIVVVDFFATWCGPCVAIAPLFEQASYSYPTSSSSSSTVHFVKINVEGGAAGVARRFGVTAMPTFIVVHNGAQVYKGTGGSALSGIHAVVQRLQEQIQGRQDQQRGQYPHTGRADGLRMPQSTPTELLLGAVAAITHQADLHANDEEEIFEKLYNMLLEDNSVPLGVPLVAFLQCDRAPHWVLQPFFEYLCCSTSSNNNDNDNNNNNNNNTVDVFDKADSAVAIVTNIIHHLMRLMLNARWGLSPSAAAAPLPVAQPAHSYDGAAHEAMNRFLSINFVCRVLSHPSTAVAQTRMLGKITDSQAKQSKMAVVTEEEDPATLTASMLRRDYMTASVLFLPDEDSLLQTGFELQRRTLLGAVLSPAPWSGSSGIVRQQMLAQHFSPVSTMENSVGLVGQLREGIGRNVDLAYPIFRTLLGNKLTRPVTLRWISKFLELNEGHNKTAPDDDGTLASEFAMVTLANVLVRLTLPKLEEIPTKVGVEYTYDLGNGVEAVEELLKTLPSSHDNDNDSDTEAQDRKALAEWLCNRSLVHFDKDRYKVDRVVHFAVPGPDGTVPDSDAADPLLPQVPPRPLPPSLPNRAAVVSFIEGELAVHPPWVHFFYMALRALGLTQTAMFSRLKLATIRLQRAEVPPPVRAFLAGEVVLPQAILSNPLLATDVINFFNCVAGWQLRQLGYADGCSEELPASPPLNWQVMPQQIFDDVLGSLRLVNILKTINFSEFRKVVTLTFTLMGNTTYIPKVHVHAVFSKIINTLLTKYQIPTFEHELFKKNVIIGLMKVFVAMDLREFGGDRFVVMQELKQLLEKVPDLRYAVAPLLEKKFARLFAANVTSEATSAIDAGLEVLAEVAAGPNSDSASPDTNNNDNNNVNNNNDTEEEGNGEEEEDAMDGTRGNGDGNTTATRNNRNLQEQQQTARASFAVFTVSVEVLTLMSNHFSNVMLQDRVVEQSCNMLIISLVKLAGPHSTRYRVPDPTQFDFKPKELLRLIVECLSPLQRHSNIFLKALCESLRNLSGYTVPPLEAFMNALDRISAKGLVPGGEMTIDWMRVSVAEAMAQGEEDEKLWDSMPEWSKCPLGCDPLLDPVVLPTPLDESGYVYVNRDNIVQGLLVRRQNPYTREPLTEEELDEFNRRPEVREAVGRLRNRIEEELKRHRGTKAHRPE